LLESKVMFVMIVVVDWGEMWDLTGKFQQMKLQLKRPKLDSKLRTTIKPVDLPPIHSLCKNASYALRPCNSLRTDSSTPIRTAYSQKCHIWYYRTGCWV